MEGCKGFMVKVFSYPHIGVFVVLVKTQIKLSRNSDKTQTKGQPKTQHES